MGRRGQPLSGVLGPLESEVMDVIWDHDEVTVRDVHLELRRARPIAYTTVMTTMGRLADKGLLARIEDQPAHQYSALVTRDQYADSTVKSLVDWLVNHFRDPAVAYFVDRVEKGDLELIDRLRDALEEKRSTGGDD